MIRTPLFTTVAALVAVFAASAASANSVYRWVDRNGVAHYDDTSTTREKMTLEYLAKREIAPATDWSGTVPAELVMEAKDQCVNLKDRLADTRGASQLYGRDPNGNSYPLSATQTHLLIEETEAQMHYWCRPDAARKIYSEALARRRAEEKAAAVVPKSRPIPVQKVTSIR
ncbi:MAG TPA: DUF4124 domain-containing protein [Nevskiaceae bacterium]|nr:DUF4124 domain-containing protein [Nevskiaceae bacterium]